MAGYKAHGQSFVGPMLLGCLELLLGRHTLTFAAGAVLLGCRAQVRQLPPTAVASIAAAAARYRSVAIASRCTLY